MTVLRESTTIGDHRIEPGVEARIHGPGPWPWGRKLKAYYE